MCEFISWIEKNGRLYYLTDEIIAERLGEFKAHNSGWRVDLLGHGTIRWWFGLKYREGMDKECTDFSSPMHFPEEIGVNIKAGRMTYASIPLGLLLPPLYANYEAKRDALEANYEAKRDALYANYEAKRAPLYANYEAKWAPLYANYEAKWDALEADYKAKWDALEADYEAKRAPLEADYKAKRDALEANYKAKRDALEAKQWKLFEITYNRIDTWR